MDSSPSSPDSIDVLKQMPTTNPPPLTRVMGYAKLPQRIAADIAAAATATFLVSPIICLIDRSIIENASNRSPSVLHSLRTSIASLLLRPQTFLLSKPFALIFMTYSGTYLTANLIDTFSSSRSGAPITAVTAGTSKFLCTSAANMSLGLLKDRSFARMFGSGPPRAVPAPVFLLFSARDAMTIAFSFNVPPRLTPYMPTGGFMKPESYAQFLAPAACQLFSTPLHLSGLEIYNSGGWRGVWGAIKTNYVQSAAARMCRIIPAFGVGGVMNRGMRAELMGRIESGGL